MKIALINEFSQASKNATVLNELKKVVVYGEIGDIQRYQFNLWTKPYGYPKNRWLNYFLFRFQQLTLN